jgi:hypothetical protein
MEPMDGLVEMGLSTCAERCFRAQRLRYMCLDLSVLESRERQTRIQRAIQNEAWLLEISFNTSWLESGSSYLCSPFFT